MQQIFINSSLDYLASKMRIPLAITFLFLCFSYISNAQLVLNEMSQGQSGAKEYIEMVVTGVKTCSDSTADLRGWVVDDNNGWLGTGTGQGIALGCMRFSNSTNWSKVPYGAVILIYNDGDKNSSILVPDDVSDADHDYMYIIPASSAELENNSVVPASPSNANFIYPTSGFSSGGSWARMGLANGGDAVIITSPANLTAAYFSFGYGSINNSGAATVYLSSSGSAKCYYLSGNQYNISSSWIAGNSPGDETPGAFNNAANGNWITSLRQFSNAAVARDTTKLSGCSNVIHNGNAYTSSTILIDTVKAVGGCDSIYHVTDIAIQGLSNVSVTASGPTTFCGGDSVILSATAGAPGNYTYSWLPGNETSAAITVHTTGNYSVTVTNVNGCSSTASVAVRTIAATTENKTLSGCSSVVFNANTYTASIVINDTLRSIGGCDSIYNNTAIVVQAITPVSQHITLHGCESISYNGIVYLSSTSKQDTIRSLGGCDTILITANLIVDSISTVNIVDSFNQGQFYTLPSGITVNTPGTYTSRLTKINGCDSIIDITLVEIKSSCLLNPPNIFTPNGDGYNDVWKVFAEACFIKCKVSVYNRYGSLVYSSDNYNNDWNGTYKNRPLPDATYYYVIKATPYTGNLRFGYGNVTIMR